MWTEMYNQLSERDKEQFTKYVNQLLATTYAVRNVWDSAIAGVSINRQYSFIERHFDLFRDYLKVAGWVLRKDNDFGVIHIQNEFDYNRVRLDKITTYVLYILRLIYDEKKESISLRREVVTTVGEVMAKMMSIGLIDRKMSIQDTRSIFNQLRNYNVLERLEGGWGDADTRVMIYPTILFVVTNEKISAIYDMMVSYDDLDTDDEEGDDDEEIDEITLD